MDRSTRNLLILLAAFFAFTWVAGQAWNTPPVEPGECFTDWDGRSNSELC